MHYLPVYAIQVAVISTLLYIGYKWMLSNTTFHAFNRIMILTIYGVSFLLPLFIPLITVKTQQASIEIGMPMAVAMIENIDGGKTITEKAIDWGLSVRIIYYSGLSICLVATLISVLRTMFLFRRADKVEGSDNVYVSVNASGPFNFGKKIMIRPEDTIDADYYEILAHEEAHIRFSHWADLLIAHIVIVLQWFNPVAYLLLRELRLVHEYQVDEIMAEGNPYRYQMMLIKKAVGSGFPSFANSLNSQLKLRITMMLSKKTGGRRRLAAVALIPMATIAVVTLSQPAMATLFSTLSPAVTNPEAPMISATSEIIDEISSVAETENSSAESENRVPDFKAVTSGEEVQPVITEAVEASPNNSNDQKEKKVFATAEKIAEYPGGQSALKDYLITNIKMPEGVEKRTMVIASFTVETDGKISDIEIKKSGGEACDAEAIRVIKGMPDWIPSSTDGKPVATTFTLPIVFKVTDGSNLKSNQSSVSKEAGKSNANYKTDKEEVYKTVEQIADFPGGQSALIDFLSKNVKYPADVTGKVRVIAQFVIKSNGEVSDIKILKSGGEACDAETIRVLKLMPNWIPAKVNGKVVASQFTLPVIFSSKSN